MLYFVAFFSLRKITHYILNQANQPTYTARILSAAFVKCCKRSLIIYSRYYSSHDRNDSVTFVILCNNVICFTFSSLNNMNAYRAIEGILDCKLDRKQKKGKNEQFSHSFKLTCYREMQRYADCVVALFIKYLSLK